MRTETSLKSFWKIEERERPSVNARVSTPVVCVGSPRVWIVFTAEDSSENFLAISLFFSPSAPLNATFANYNPDGNANIANLFSRAAGYERSCAFSTRKRDGIKTVFRVRRNGTATRSRFRSARLLRVPRGENISGSLGLRGQPLMIMIQ